MNRDSEVDPESENCMDQAGVSWPRNWLDQAFTWFSSGSMYIFHLHTYIYIYIHRIHENI